MIKAFLICLIYAVLFIALGEGPVYSMNFRWPF